MFLEILENLPDKVYTGEELNVRVTIEEGRPRCFLYDDKDHVRSECKDKGTLLSKRKEHNKTTKLGINEITRKTAETNGERSDGKTRRKAEKKTEKEATRED